MGWMVRRAVPADAAEVARINVDGWRTAYADIVPDAVLDGLDAGAWEARYRWALDQPEPVAVFLAVAEDGRIGAFCSACPVRDPDRDAHPGLPTGQIPALYADPRARGTGAGHAVHEAAVAHLAAAGFGHAVLWVLQANDGARRFYERHAWSRDQVPVVYPLVQAEGVPAVRYSRRLDRT